MQQPEVAGFYDARTGSVQYVVACPSSRKCAIIDPVLDFDEKSGSTATTNADVILDYVNSGKPIVGLRTSTHAFRYPKGENTKYNDGFGREVFGQRWIKHHGHDSCSWRLRSASLSWGSAALPCSPQPPSPRALALECCI